MNSANTGNLTGCELLRRCAADLKDAEVWDEFYSRYRPIIMACLLRAFRMFGRRPEEFSRYAEDWTQELFTKLVQDNGATLRSFHGSTDVSIYAFLASIAVSIVADHLRYGQALRRKGIVVGLDDVEEFDVVDGAANARISALLELIDVERALKEDAESKHPERDLLIFKLHFVDGHSASEIASIPAFNLTTSGLEKVLNRLRDRLSRKRS